MKRRIAECVLGVACIFALAFTPGPEPAPRGPSRPGLLNSGLLHYEAGTDGMLTSYVGPPRGVNGEPHEADDVEDLFRESGPGVDDPFREAEELPKPEPDAPQFEPNLVARPIALKSIGDLVQVGDVLYQITTEPAVPNPHRGMFLSPVDSLPPAPPEPPVGMSPIAGPEEPKHWFTIEVLPTLREGHRDWPPMVLVLDQVTGTIDQFHSLPEGKILWKGRSKPIYIPPKGKR